MHAWGSAVVDLTERLFQPVFEEPKGEAPNRTARQRDDAAALKTYRYLRLGMVVVAIALLSSVLIERVNAGCWQGSISAYYYTSARPVFVSGLVAIAVSLIVIKGSTVVEDSLLNVAGMLAPIVAFVPTTFEPSCASDQPLSSGGPLPQSIVNDVHNNIGSLLIAGLAGLVVAALVLVLEQRGDDRLTTRHYLTLLSLVALTAVVLAVGTWLLATDAILDYHGWSAVAMFGVLAIASIFNGGWLFWINARNDQSTSRHWRRFAISYVAVGAVMVVAGVVIQFGWPDPWDHRTLVLEIVEIGLFATMWIIQSVERWGKILQATP